ncbi:lysophospholipid acyltransferase family protein [Desulfococcaceae bacterium HSG8]|nr:lysophospholipid acyltransferase family protein [Desulfococcaceae bacterium HSG8]
MKTEKTAYRLISLCFKLLGLIPQKWGQRLGCLMGRLLFIADAKHRKIAMRNLTYALDTTPSQVKKISIEVFENMGKIIFEMAWSLGLDEKRLFRYFNIRGLSHIRDAYEKGRGVLILTAHFGNWELLSVIGAIIGYPLSIVYRPLDFKPMDQFILDFRGRFGGEFIPKKKSMRRVLRSLKRGQLITLLMDQNVAWYEGVFTDFFGHRACTNKGMALLALKTEAPVVPVFLMREKSGFTAHFLPEVPLIKTGDRTRDVEENTQEYNNVIESFVRQYPRQWFWVHQRWKTRPFCQVKRDALVRVSDLNRH